MHQIGKETVRRVWKGINKMGQSCIRKDKKILFIINPNSGTKRAAKMLSDIIQVFSDSGYLTSVLMTKAQGDATDFVIKYGEEAGMIVCSGGDGTFNEVLSGLLIGGIDCKLAYIPSGSTNDYANSVGIAKGIIPAAEQIMSGKPRTLDVGTVNGRYFSYIASFGAFTSTSYSVPQNLKNILGHTAYVLQGAKDIVNIKPIHVKISADVGTPNEAICEGDYIFGAICNSTSIAGILKLDSFDVDMNDGLMEVLLVKAPRSLPALNEIIKSMLDGRLESDEIEFFSAKDITVEFNEAIPWTVDGEYAEGSEKMEIRTVRSAYDIIV